MRKPYPTDLTDDQWAVLRPLLPPAESGGAPRTAEVREALNPLFYQARTGCQWDMLPHDLLPRSTAFDYLHRWETDGTWQRLLDALRQRARTAAGREAAPRVAYIDSQTVKTTEMGGDRGYDGGKKVAGRKRHYRVDSLGLLMAVAVTGAAWDDGTAAPAVLSPLTPAMTGRLETIWGDGRYHNHALHAWHAWLRGAGATYQVLVVRGPKGPRGSCCCRSGGWWSGASPGSADIGG